MVSLAPPLLSSAEGAPPAGTTAGAERAPDDAQARRAQDINRATMSPFCPGRTLDGCPSPYAAKWREDIRRWVSEGVSNDEIRSRLNARTNEDLTGAPSTVLDSVLPILAVVLSLLLLVFLLRVLVKPGKAPAPRKRRPKEDVPPADPKKLDERLDDELNDLDG
jgi:cytochrome c-type biogenesis protein CcmH/NrfF